MDRREEKESRRSPGGGTCLQLFSSTSLGVSSVKIAVFCHISISNHHGLCLSLVHLCPHSQPQSEAEALRQCKDTVLCWVIKNDASIWLIWFSLHPAVYSIPGLCWQHMYTEFCLCMSTWWWREQGEDASVTLVGLLKLDQSPYPSCSAPHGPQATQGSSVTPPLVHLPQSCTVHVWHTHPSHSISPPIA